MKKVLLTGGGTSGHVTANLALMHLLNKENYEIFYIGRKIGIEKDLVEAVDYAKVKYYGISSGKLRRELNFENFKDFFRVGKGFFEAKKILKEIKPDIIFSKGGFVVVPVILAAKTLNIPIIIHESDFTPGLANKIAIPYAKVVCTSFESTMKFIKDGKAFYTGSPIREEVLKGDYNIGKTFTKFKDNKKVLLLIGGSQGAKKLNEVLRTTLQKNMLDDFNIIHIVGKGNINDELSFDNYRQYEYLNNELPHILAYSDYVITRGGANTLFELLALKKPHIIVPLSKKASRGDQIENAKEFSEKGYSMVILEEDFTENTLKHTLTELNKNCNTYINNMSKYDKNNTLETIMQIIKNNIN